jgi:DNA-binding response OmpR family regulator
MARQKVLIVDDNVDQRTMLKLFLEMEGFEIALAGNGDEALAALERQPFDVVVTDLFMPDKDGIETITEVKKRAPQTRIVALSGWVSQRGSDYLSVAREIGADAALRKSADPQELVAILRAFAD